MAELKGDDKTLEAFIRELYDISKITEEEYRTWFDAYSYKGFDRKKVLKDLMTKVGDAKISNQIILICGLNGPVKAVQFKLLNGRTVQSYGISANGGKGNTNLTCGKITAATADLCAHLLKKSNAPKRINMDLPGWLQFPSAGSIKMSDEMRKKHIEFSKVFSERIGGDFNEQIYEAMVANAYLDPSLRLFQ